MEKMTTRVVPATLLCTCTLISLALAQSNKAPPVVQKPSDETVLRKIEEKRAERFKRLRNALEPPKRANSAQRKLFEQFRDDVLTAVKVHEAAELDGEKSPLERPSYSDLSKDERTKMNRYQIMQYKYDDRVIATARDLLEWEAAENDRDEKRLAKAREILNSGAASIPDKPDAGKGRK